MTRQNSLYDFAPLYRSFVGLDRMANMIDAASQSANANNSFPPYNIVRLSEDAYRIELAVAGFGEDDLEIESHQNVLTVTGRIETADNDTHDSDAGEPAPQYLHRGIAERGFQRRFQLADHVIVKDAALRNGLLSIALERQLPEALKPRTITISRGETISANRGEKLISSKSGSKTKAA